MASETGSRATAQYQLQTLSGSLDTSEHSYLQTVLPDASGLSAQLRTWGRDIQQPGPVAVENECSTWRFPIVVHCHLRWDFVWQRPQQIFSRLAVAHRILFIEDPMEGQGEPRLEITEPMSNVIRVVPIFPASSGSFDERCQLSLALIRDAMDEHPMLAGQFEHPVQWFYSPMTAPCFLGQFDAGAIVYDCMDELANFRFAPPEICEREQFLLSRADVVFTGGYQLFESKSRRHSNVHFHGCGVDVAHFGQARLPQTEVPAAVASLPGPVLGYFGVIDERLDYPLLEALARALPEASVVMAGPVVKVEKSQLPELPNIHWLGQIDYEALPALVKGFDVCLMPFALNDATRYINPTKTLEYMAAGKPIVSSAVADVVRNFTPIVDVADSAEEFIGCVQRACKHPPVDLIAEGLRRADSASWEAIVSAMDQQVRIAMNLAQTGSTSARIVAGALQ